VSSYLRTRATLLALGCIGAATLTQSATAEPVSSEVSSAHERTTTRTQSADVQLESARRVTCADGRTPTEETSVVLAARSIVATEQRTEPGSQFVNLFLTVTEPCRSTVFDAFQLNRQATYVQKQRSATLSGTFTLVSSSTQERRTAVVSVAFEPSDTSESTFSRSTRVSPGRRTTFALRTSSTEAHITGSITVDGGPNLLASEDSTVRGGFGRTVENESSTTTPVPSS
jgi:hypothetical protein